VQEKAKLTSASKKDGGNTCTGPRRAIQKCKLNVIKIFKKNNDKNQKQSPAKNKERKAYDPNQTR